MHVLAESGSFRAGNSRFGYLLRRREGFHVDSPNGRVGLVAEPRYGSSLEEPDAIAVRVGPRGRLLLIVPAGEIEEIFPRERPRPSAPVAATHGHRPRVGVGICNPDGRERWKWQDRFAP